MDYKALAQWALGGSTGLSSKCIALHMCGLEANGHYPHDSGDFGRCETLLEAVPGLRERLDEMKGVNTYWAALVPRWEEIRTAPKDEQTDLIRSIVRPIQNADPRVITIGDGITMTIGR